MTKTKIYLGLCVLGLVFLWTVFFKSPEPSPETAVRKDFFTEDVSNNKDVDEAELTLEPQLKAPKKKAFKRPTKTIKKPKPIKSFEVFEEKSRDQVYFKVKDGLALTGEDQIVGFVDKDYDDKKIFKTKATQTSLWPEGVIPYTYDKKFPLSLQKKVERAIDYFLKETPIRFVNYDEQSDVDAVVFTFSKNKPCSSFVGRVGGLQKIFLNNTCSFQSVLHEIMHTIGFVHEQQLPFRDDYIKINWSDLLEGSYHNFSYIPEVWLEPILDVVDDFDYSSIMMYSKYAYAKTGKVSMRTLTENKINPVQNGLSKKDLERVNILY
jgi:hypothetical protein